jgi:hypothetical protein
MSLQFGLDPEYFAVISWNKQPYVISPAMLEKFSGLKYLETDELDKHPIYIKEKDFSWMQDGVAFELTILHPLNSAKEMFEIVSKALTYLEEFLSKLKFEGLELSLYKKPVVNINPEIYIPYLNENKIHQGFIFGCDPDKDCFFPDYKCETVDVISHLFRYGGGHFHISGSKAFQKYIIPAVKLMAVCVGNFVTLNSLFPEEDKQRVSTYGRPGRYRPQKYSNGSFGIEYRTPSNSWTSLPEEKYDELVFWAIKATEFLENRRIDILETFVDDTIKAIINADKNLSKEILDEIR